MSLEERLNRIIEVQTDLEAEDASTDPAIIARREARNERIAKRDKDFQEKAELERAVGEYLDQGE